MKYIHQIIKNNQDVKQYVNTDNSLYALIANADTPYPYIVYSRTACTPVYTKDFVSDNKIDFEINIVSDKYLESITVANIIRNLLECKMIRNEELTSTYIKLTGASERYSNDAYVQTLNFTTTAT